MKKRKPNTAAKLSPEKYIRTQARTLPLHECLINTTWKESMIASILVSRKHSNGHFTAAVYLVDLYCMGIKTSDFLFNIIEEEYNDFKHKYFPEEFFGPIDYTLAHNILFAGLEFANEYGFKPCKEFVESTQFILEEDNDDIEVIEIECGSDDMPVVIAGYDNREEAEYAYNHLFNTIGPDKFIFTDYNDIKDEASKLLGLEDDIDDIDDMDEIEDEEDLPIEDYMYEKPLSERLEDIKRFKELQDPQKHTTDDESVELLFICKRLFYNYYGLEKIEASRNRFLDFLDVSINDDFIPVQLSGSQEGKHDEDIEEVIDDLSFGDDFKKYNFKKLASKHPEVHFYSFMHIVQMNMNQIDSKKIAKQLDEYLSIYPNNTLLKLERDQLLATSNQKTIVINKKLIDESTLSQLFNKRVAIHSLEYFTFHSALFAYLALKEDLLAMDSFIYCSNLLFPEFAESGTEKELYSEIQKISFCRKTYLL